MRELGRGMRGQLIGARTRHFLVELDLPAAELMGSILLGRRNSDAVTSCKPPEPILIKDGFSPSFGNGRRSAVKYRVAESFVVMSRIIGDAICTGRMTGQGL